MVRDWQRPCPRIRLLNFHCVLTWGRQEGALWGLFHKNMNPTQWLPFMCRISTPGWCRELFILWPCFPSKIVITSLLCRNHNPLYFSPVSLWQSSWCWLKLIFLPAQYVVITRCHFPDKVYISQSICIKVQRETSFYPRNISRSDWYHFSAKALRSRCAFSKLFPLPLDGCRVLKVPDAEVTSWKDPSF